MSTLRLAADDPEGAEADVAAGPGASGTRKDFTSSTTNGSARRSRSSSTAVMARAPGISSRRSTSRRWLDRTSRASRRSGSSSTSGGLAALWPRPSGPRDPGPLLRAAERDARRLHREGMAWSRALACPIRAGIAAARGDRSRAATLFAEAVTQLEAVDMNLYAAASRRRLGEILGGDEGRAQVERADSWMRQQTIQNPARMADVFAPVVA